MMVSVSLGESVVVCLIKLVHSGVVMLNAGVTPNTSGILVIILIITSKSLNVVYQLAKKT